MGYIVHRINLANPTTHAKISDILSLSVYSDIPRQFAGLPLGVASVVVLRWLVAQGMMM